MRWRRGSQFATAGMAILALVACGGSSGGGGTTTALNIAFLPKAVNNPYFDVAASGGQEAATALSGQFKQVGPSDATGAAQIPFIQTLTQQNVSAIVVSADDPDAIAPALKQAMAKGIKVVGYDSSPAKDARNVFINQADSKGIGVVQVQMICDEIPGCAGEIAVLSATSTATNQNAWIQAMKDELASNSKYSGLKLVKVAYGNDDPQVSTTEAQALLTSYPNLKGIISPTTVGISAAAQVLKQTGKAGKVQLTGLGTPNLMRAFVKDGTCKEFALWNVKDLGYLAYYTAALLVQGKIKGNPGEKFTAGRLGDYTIDPNGVVLLGPPFVFKADNIDQLNF
ncbi:MAG: rhamnose ABC transporter substrate-binding protein [Chloroflexi bacterium]|nr:MAG: rhamnose ABC transporter substrate-binding protein [Chloroflexota bacterium]TMG17616.1 MAG: rhamnose ABC transporter substrate-binding protein [Chloroflexota bacterium]TMG65456.1 MAG: rhamnose ABC transporter substrate-binding protein [Chloroflexota bacterium]